MATKRKKTAPKTVKVVYRSKPAKKRRKAKKSLLDKLLSF